MQERQPKEQLVCLKDFEFGDLGQKFDYALAQSVFTHLNLNKIKRCLDRLAPAMKVGGKFYATFLEAPSEASLEEPLKHPGCVTHSCRDPFHYRVEDFYHVIKGMQWKLDYYGQWEHPADARVLIFERTK